MLKKLGDFPKKKHPLSTGFISFCLGFTLLLSGACGEITPTPANPGKEISPSIPIPTSTPGELLRPSLTPSPPSPSPSSVPTTGETSTAGTGNKTLSPATGSESPAQNSPTVLPAQTQPLPTATPDNNPGRAFEHVLIVVMENADYSTAIIQPYFKQLASEGTLFTNYFGVAHPSYPNYLAMVAGTTFGIRDDGQVTLDQTNLVDLLEKAGLTWKFYAEQYPANQCFTGAVRGDYARKHLPVLSFKNVQNDPALCAKVVPASQLNADIAAGNLPNFAFYVPDQKNDGHDTGAAYGSNWLGGFLPNILFNAKLMASTLVVVTFDEANDPNNNRIYTVLAGPLVKSGSTNNTPFTHYDLLKTVEDNFHLGNLGREDAKAKGFLDVWQVKN